MSQAKVEQYKKAKANRKKAVVKERIRRRCTVAAVWVVLAVIAGWAGVSIYGMYEESRPAETYTVDTTAITDYLNGLAAVDGE